MTIHLFQDRNTDVFAFTNDGSGSNLPLKNDRLWVFLETLEPVRVAWGEELFQEVFDTIAKEGFFVFFGEKIPRAEEVREAHADVSRNSAPDADARNEAMQRKRMRKSKANG